MYCASLGSQKKMVAAVRRCDSATQFRSEEAKAQLEGENARDAAPRRSSSPSRILLALAAILLALAAMPSASSCSTALGALIAVSISGKVKESILPGVAVGDELTVSFLAEPTALVREIEGQGIVQDGIGVHRVCTEDFAVKFSSGAVGHALLPPALPAAPVVQGVPAGGLWFSVMKGRVIYDGGWVSTDPTDASKGVPLDFHDKATYGGVFDISLLRHSMPSLELPEAVGSYDAKLAVDATLTVWKDWTSNFVISADFDKLTMSTAKEL